MTDRWGFEPDEPDANGYTGSDLRRRLGNKLFKWRSMADVPRDGTPFVHLAFHWYGVPVGRPAYPLALRPVLTLLQDTGGWNWHECRFDTGMKRLDAAVGHWMLVDEYRTATDELSKSWDRIPMEDRPPHFVLEEPLVLVRPIWPRVPMSRQRRIETLLRQDTCSRYADMVLDAEVAWRAHGGLASVISRGETALAPGYLDGLNVNAHPFRWCSVEDFFPTGVIEEHERLKRQRDQIMAEYDRGIR